MNLKIREFRKAAGLTQNELAEKLGVNRATVSKYESGDISISTLQLERIAEIFGVSVQDLMSGSAGEELATFREWELDIIMMTLWVREAEILIVALQEYIDRGNHSKNDTYEAEKLLARAKCTIYPQSP